MAGARGDATVRVLSREIPMFEVDGGLRALVPVPLGTDAGSKTLTVSMGKDRIRSALRVLGRVEPPRQRLRRLAVTEQVSADLKAGNAVLGRAFRRTDAKAMWTSPFRFPLQGRLTSGYGITRSYAGTAQWPHRGIDLAAPEGWPVVAAAAGVVQISRFLDGYGNTVVLDHGQTVHTVYFHMSSRAVKEGRRVEAGQVIGLVGDTGLAKGAHLHFGAYIGAVAVDPEELLSRGLP